jgi:hypothetical protein
MTTIDAAEITRATREPRYIAVNLILTADNPDITLALLEGMWVTQPEVLAMLAEVGTLRGQGAPLSAYAAWHRDLCTLLRRLMQQAAEADAEAERRSGAIPDALAALGLPRQVHDR